MPLLRFSFPLGRPTLSQFPADCSEKAQRDFSPRVVHTLFLLNLGLQLFDEVDRLPAIPRFSNNFHRGFVPEHGLEAFDE